ncbi:PLP-dependent aminotransferase family protein [Amycolatopsis jejuensis]|uniref:aminotransferase-like domain-containing protein n=1 Tax=Amycolatopsis jejuensis TaxID=330084 RepID=UPI00138E11C6|nr:PLP-dependent aminotransferase family protein [Amycolatopsis jejuensis]
MPDVRPREMIPAEQLVAILGHWSEGSAPLYEQLAEAMRAAVRRGELAPGVLLPPQRALAGLLAVSRTTVIATVDLLRSEGWLHSVQGSGTWVTRPQGAPHGPSAGPPSSHRVRRLIHESGSRFRRTALDLGSAIFDEPCWPSGVSIDGLRDDLDSLARLSGEMACGVRELREEIAEFLTRRGLPTTFDQICITTGAQQAVWLAATYFSEPMRPVVVEDPTWVAALDVVRSLQCPILSVPVDRQGLSVLTLERLLQRTRPAMVLTVPEFHNPTGARMPEPRRDRLATLSAEYQVPVVEDLSLWGLSLRPGGDRLNSIAACRPDAPVVTIGSFTKLLWHGIRVGWIRAREDVISRIAQLKVTVDAGTPELCQLLAARSLPVIDEVCARRTAHLEASLAVIDDWLGSLDPAWSYEVPDGGMSIWTRLPVGNAMEFSQVALRHSVDFWPGNVFSATHAHGDRVRLPLGRRLDYLGEALGRLEVAWNEYLGR